MGRNIRDVGVAGSNPATPTKNQPKQTNYLATRSKLTGGCRDSYRDRNAYRTPPTAQLDRDDIARRQLNPPLRTKPRQQDRDALARRLALEQPQGDPGTVRSSPALGRRA
jgi:hypothetical protein